MEWTQIKRKLLRDPETAREYEALRPQYELANSIIGLRVAKGWTPRTAPARAGVKQADVAVLECKPSLSVLQPRGGSARCAGGRAA
jgi:hypothetical protein